MTESEMDELADQLLTASMIVHGCNHGTTRWCCEYHDGFEDGMNMLIERMERKDNA